MLVELLDHLLVRVGAHVGTQRRDRLRGSLRPDAGRRRDEHQVRFVLAVRRSVRRLESGHRRRHGVEVLGLELKGADAGDAAVERRQRGRAAAER